jgi:hypothetical protein
LDRRWTPPPHSRFSPWVRGATRGLAEETAPCAGGASPCSDSSPRCTC